MLRINESNSASLNRDKQVWLAPIQDAHMEAVKACRELWNALGAMESVSLTAQEELHAARGMTTTVLDQLQEIKLKLDTVSTVLQDE